MSTKLKMGFVPGDRAVFSTVWALRMRDRCVTALKGMQNLELVLPDPANTTQGLVRTVEQAQLVANQFRRQGVQRLLLGTMNFGDEEAMTEVVRLLPLPTLLLGTPDAVLADGRRAGSDSFCGTLSVSMNLHTAGLPFTFAGILDPDAPAFREAVETFLHTPDDELLRQCRARFDRPGPAASLDAQALKAGAAAAGDFRGTRLGQFGPRASGFVTCAFDERQLLRQFSQRVVPVDLATVFGRAQRLAADDPDLLAAAARIATDTAVAVGPQVVERMARLYVTLRSLILEHRLDALGHNCWTALQNEYGISGCAVFSLVEEDGWPIACETDVYGAATLLLQKCVARRLGSDARPFFMDWTVQHPTDSDLFQAWHCGKAPLSVFRAKPAVRSHEILGPLLGEDRCGGTLEGEFRTGPVTLVRLTEYGGRFRALIARGVIEPSPWKQMRGSWGWVRVPGLNNLYRTLIEQGFSHHVSMIHGDHAQATAAACEQLGVQVVWQA